MSPPLQVIKRSRPWTEEDLPKPLLIDHPSAFRETVRVVRSETGDLDYYKQSITTNLYNCNSCRNIVDCLETISGARQEGEIIVKRGKFVTDIINRVFSGKCCSICIKGSGQYNSRFLPGGWVCSGECELKFMTDFVVPFINNPHRLRAAWYSSLDLGSLYYMWNEPKCGMHHTNRACMLHYVDYGRLDYMVRNGENSVSNRRKRFRKQKRDFRGIPTNLLDFLDRKSAGAICGGIKCDNDLSLNEYRGPNLPSLNLQFCSMACKKQVTSHLHKVGSTGYHGDKREVIFKSLEYLFLLSTKGLRHELYQTGRMKSAREELGTEFRRICTPQGSKCNAVEGSVMVISFNMQGNNNARKVRTYIKANKPAIVGLQETRIKEGKPHGFESLVEYDCYTCENDVAMLIRKDLGVENVGLIQGVDIPHLKATLAVNDKRINIVNAYARDGTLNTTLLESLEGIPNLLLMGDLNAKHQDILPHTQDTPSNANGRALRNFLLGHGASEDDQDLNGGAWHILNHKDVNVYTHTNGNGGWVQIDLMLCSHSIVEWLGHLQYEYKLRSDHVAVMTPLEILAPVYRTKGKTTVRKWDLMNVTKYKAITEAEIGVMMESETWEESSVETKVLLLTDIQRRAAHICVPTVTRKDTRKPIPFRVQMKIKRRRSLKSRLRRLELQAWRRSNLGEQAPYPPPGVSYADQGPLWDNFKISKELEMAPVRRGIIAQLDKEIDDDLTEFRNKGWDIELNKLANMDPIKAPKKFWSKIKQLSGNGTGNIIASIKYNGRQASSPQEVANLLGEYVQDVFQPLEDPGFNKEYFARIEREYSLGMSILKHDIRSEEFVEYVPRANSYLVDGILVGEDEFVPPNPTKHQREQWGAMSSKKFKQTKQPLSPAPKSEARIGTDWKPLRDEAHDIVNAGIGRREIRAAIKKMKRKAPGHDELYIDTYKHLGNRGIKCLREIYNQIYATGDMPLTWKHAILAPLLKKGKNGQKPESYRPISLLPVGGKILEGVLLPRFNKYLEGRGLIPCHQTGFRKGMGTVINLKRLYNHIYLQSSRSPLSRPTAAVLFDAKKAFDSVWHKGLLHKCLTDHLPKSMIVFLESWLDKRSLQVRVGDLLSNIVELKSGVPQGALLSPLLWNYWTGDCPTTENTTSDSSLYADDCAAWTTQTNASKTIGELQREVWRLNDWTRKKRIKFEKTKTNLLACHPTPRKREEMKSHTIYLDRECREGLTWVPHAVFLGVTFSENCTFQRHWDVQLKKCHARLSTIMRFKGKVKPNILYRVYKAAIEPIVTYASEVLFDSLSDIDLKRLLALEFRAIRIAYNLESRAPIVDCLQYLKESIVGRIERRRDKFLHNNYARDIIQHTEFLKYSEGRRVAVREKFKNRNTPSNWKASLYQHKDFVYMSGGTGTLARGGVELPGIKLGECLDDVERSHDRLYSPVAIPKFTIRPYRNTERGARLLEIKTLKRLRSNIHKWRRWQDTGTDNPPTPLEPHSDHPYSSQTPQGGALGNISEGLASSPAGSQDPHWDHYYSSLSMLTGDSRGTQGGAG